MKKGIGVEAMDRDQKLPKTLYSADYDDADDYRTILGCIIKKLDLIIDWYSCYHGIRGRDVVLFLDLGDMADLECTHNEQGSYMLLHDIASSKHIASLGYSNTSPPCYIAVRNPKLRNDGRYSLFSKI